MMTTFAMVIGMLPIALSNGPGSESRAPMALAIIGGLISSMFLTLIIVPVMYYMLDNGLNFISGLFKQKDKPSVEEKV
jgi:HAE1 family hydrophobic/amphiphilic exporter-1